MILAEGYLLLILLHCMAMLKLTLGADLLETLINNKKSPTVQEVETVGQTFLFFRRF
jgi:hypothetical protein